MAPSPFNESFHNDPLQELLSCTGHEMLGWFRGQFQQAQDMFLNQDISEGWPEGTPAAVRDQILAELFGVAANKPSSCCPGTGPKASSAGCPAQAASEQPQKEAGEEKGKRGTKSAENEGPPKSPGQRRNVGILGCLNEYLSKLEEEILKNEPGTSKSTQQEMKERLAKKLRSKREEQQNDKAENKPTQNNATPNKVSPDLETEKDGDTTGKVVDCEKQSDRKVRVRPVKPVTDEAVKNNEDQCKTVSAEDRQNTEGQKEAENREEVQENVFQVSDLNAWTLRRKDNARNVEWHLGGEPWFQPEDVKVTIEGDTLINVVIRKKEIARRLNYSAGGADGEVAVYREVRQTITTPRDVDISELTATFMPESKSIVLSAPRLRERDSNNGGLTPIPIIRKTNPTKPSK